MGKTARQPADVYALGVLLAELGWRTSEGGELPLADADGKVPPG